MLSPDKLLRKQADPSARSQGRAGVLPVIPDIEQALVSLDDTVWEQMRHEHLHGREKGRTTFNRYLDPYFKWMPGYTSVITGWGGHGKSQMFFELLLLQAVFGEKKSVLWPSENLPAKRFYERLIHTLTGRPTDRTFANALSEKEYERAKNFLKEYIFLVDPPVGMPYTPAHILAYFEASVNKHGAEHCMLDPWNKCDHSAKARMGGDEPYLVHTLGLCTKWSLATGQCLVITAHPKRENENMGYGKTRSVPTGGTISGGQTWENMAHYLGAVHRPFHHIKGNRQAAFYSHKVKDEEDVASVGSIGATGATDGLPALVPIEWDPITKRYRWGHERWNPLDNPDLAQLWAPPKPSPTGQLFTAGEQPAAPAPAPPAVPDYQPDTLRTAGPSEFDHLPDLPENWHPNGRRITSTTPPQS